MGMNDTRIEKKRAHTTISMRISKIFSDREYQKCFLLRTENLIINRELDTDTNTDTDTDTDADTYTDTDTPMHTYALTLTHAHIHAHTFALCFTDIHTHSYKVTFQWIERAHTIRKDTKTDRHKHMF